MPNFSQELPWQRQKLGHEEIPFLLALRNHEPAIETRALDPRASTEKRSKRLVGRSVRY